jgi:hypothetical protein
MSLLRSFGPKRSGLLALADDFTRYVAEAWHRGGYGGTGLPEPAVGIVGWKQREQQLNQAPEGGNRLLIIPGHGRYGTRQHGGLEQPRHSGIGTREMSRQSSIGEPAALWTWPRKFTLSVWSYAPSSPDDEPTQIAASDSLLELAVGALVAAGRGSIKPAGDLYQDEWSVNLGFGLELLVPFTHGEPLYGLPKDVITDVSVAIQSSLTVAA